MFVSFKVRSVNENALDTEINSSSNLGNPFSCRRSQKFQLTLRYMVNSFHPQNRITFLKSLDTESEISSSIPEIAFICYDVYYVEKIIFLSAWSPISLTISFTIKV